MYCIFGILFRDLFIYLFIQDLATRGEYTSRCRTWSVTFVPALLRFPPLSCPSCSICMFPLSLFASQSSHSSHSSCLCSALTSEENLLLLWFHRSWCAAFVLPTFRIMQKSSLWQRESSANTAQLLTLLSTGCWQICFFMLNPGELVFYYCLAFIGHLHVLTNILFDIPTIST